MQSCNAVPASLGVTVICNTLLCVVQLSSSLFIACSHFCYSLWPLLAAGTDCLCGFSGLKTKREMVLEACWGTLLSVSSFFSSTKCSGAALVWCQKCCSGLFEGRILIHCRSVSLNTASACCKEIGSNYCLSSFVGISQRNILACLQEKSKPRCCPEYSETHWVFVQKA